MKSLTLMLVTLLALLCGSQSPWSDVGNARAAELQRFAITIKNRKVEPAQKLIRVTLETPSSSSSRPTKLRSCICTAMTS